MSKKSKFFIITLLTVVALCSLTTLALSQITRKVKDDLYSQLELYSYTLTTVQADYVEEQEPKDLIYGSLKGMVSTLDPHSQFLDPDEYKELKTETQGKFGGLGIEISVRDGLLTVVSPIEDTPAWKVGLKSKDRIVKIEDEITRNITLSDAVKKLRGKPGTDINITVLRESEGRLIDFTITREIIHVQDVKHVQILEDKIGFIRLTEFREDSGKEFRKALDDLKQQGANSLILDLRNNPGGLLNIAIDITEEFLEEGLPIVSTKGRHPTQNTKTFSKNKRHLVDWPIVVLVNDGSASGSEILAGAIKDNKRGIILGTKSFGKGSVQSVIPLPDGSGLRLTTSKYYTPSGISIHGEGIEPDILVEFVPIEEKEEASKSDQVFDGIEKEIVEETQEDAKIKKEKEARERLLNDNQVQSAINVLKGIRIVESFGSTEQES